jgi:aldose 1-epimerase
MAEARAKRCMSIERFGSFEGEDVSRLTIGTRSGMTAKLLTWGATLSDLLVADGAGRPRRVVLGFDTFESYRLHARHAGAIAGRFANRISHGALTIDGQTYQLDRNQPDAKTGEPRHHRHGGVKGFGKRTWRVLAHGDAFATFGLVSPAGDGGYPGTLTASCTYRLAEPGTLQIEIVATTDAPTAVNLVHHSYFSLDHGAPIDAQQLQIDADFTTPVDDDVIPTGEIVRVAGTAMDFRAPRAIHASAEAAARTPYDQSFVLRKRAGFGRAAVITSAPGDLAMEVWTNEPALQFNDGAGLDMPVPGHDGVTYRARSGVCLEPQRSPDSPSHAHFTNAILRPDQVYRQYSEYRFTSRS